MSVHPVTVSVVTLLVDPLDLLRIGPLLDEPREQCVELDEDGRFTFEMGWPLERFSPGTYWFMLTGATADCLSPGWAWSYKIRVR